MWRLVRMRDRAVSVGVVMMTTGGAAGAAASESIGIVGSSQPLRLVVDPRVHAGELLRFEASVVRGPGKDDCAIWASAVGADGYGRWWVHRGGT